MYPNCSDRCLVNRWASTIPFKEFGTKEIEFYKSIGIIIERPNTVLTKEQGNAILLKVMEVVGNVKEK